MVRGKGTSSCSKKKSKGNNMDLEEILREYALRYLPAKTLCRCLNVCRDWKLKISTPFFIHDQSTSFRAISGLFIQYPGRPPSFLSLDQMAYGVPDPEFNFLPEPVDVRASSNGLVCCQGRTGDMPYYVCNPVYKRWKEIPKPTVNIGWTTPAIALVFEPSLLSFVADYKLIYLYPSLGIEGAYGFEIYSSAQDSWKVHKEMWYHKPNVFFSEGICLNGTAYWVGKVTSETKVIGFDLKSERAVELFGDDSPILYDCLNRSCLGLRNGKLCWTFVDEWRIIVNEYKGRYGDKFMNDWEVKHQVPISDEDSDVDTSVVPEVLIAWDNVVVFQMGTRVCSYNLETGQTINMWESNLPEFRLRLNAFPYVNSLVCVF